MEGLLYDFLISFSLDKNMVAMVNSYIWLSEIKKKHLDRDEMCKLYRCFLPSFGLFGKVVSEEKIQMLVENKFD
jgi:hypothetical protein